MSYLWNKWIEIILNLLSDELQKSVCSVHLKKFSILKRIKLVLKQIIWEQVLNKWSKWDATKEEEERRGGGGGGDIV